MDKPSDVVFQPFSLPGDEAKVLADWKREHPQDAASMAPGDQDDGEVAARMHERAMGERTELMQREGWPQSGWRDDFNQPQSSAGIRNDEEQAEQRRSMRGGLPDAPGEARAIEGNGKPFRV
jgi:hypothetical protein